MNFLADESIDRQIVERLRQDGHQVWYVAEMEPGISDENVFDLANKERYLLITADKDFGELVFLQRRLMSGIILIRLTGLSPLNKADVIASALNKHGAELDQAFTVIMAGAIRIRKRK
ncbi:DUF5615 family PIN-like protein [Candidatus Kuenenia sp.]|uniref:DUF5615 family PIN-like protein n=1 Tax=Candidatus Kuenenia sp. TaxID=2499824 RepID=UPI0032209C37